MKQKIGLLLMLLLICVGWTGCAESSIVDEQAENPAVLDWYINYSWYTTTWGGNEVSEAITEKTGVAINFLSPKGNESEKMDAMIASDTLPDLITLGWWETQCQDMIAQDKVYAWNELADLYAPEFYEVANEMSVQWYTQSDGNLYCYPNSSYTPQDVLNSDSIASNQNFLVRKDIYEALGSPDMSTPEGFMDAIRRAAEQFPTVDGEELIPIGADEFTSLGNNSFGQYLQNFLAVPYEKDGCYYDRNTDEEYLTWLKVFRQLGEEGYLKNDIFIDKRSQLEEKLQNGRYFCLFYQNSDINDQQKILYQNHPERIYIAVDGPKNSAGDEPILPVPGIRGWTVTFISKNCKDPEKAIQFLTYLISEEGQKLLYLGVEGSMYDIVDGKPVIRQEVLELLNSNRVEYNKKYAADDTYWMLQNNVMQLKWQYDTPEYITQMQRWTYPYVAYTAQYDLNFDEDARGKNLHTIQQTIWGRTLPRLLLAKSEEEFDTILQEYMQERDVAGYQEYCELATEQFQRDKQRLGLE